MKGEGPDIDQLDDAWTSPLAVIGVSDLNPKA